MPPRMPEMGAISPERVNKSMKQLEDEAKLRQLHAKRRLRIAMNNFLGDEGHHNPQVAINADDGLRSEDEAKRRLRIAVNNFVGDHNLLDPHIIEEQLPEAVEPMASVNIEMRNWIALMQAAIECRPACVSLNFTEQRQLGILKTKLEHLLNRISS